MIGRYAGVVEMLADLLRASGFRVVRPVALDRGDPIAAPPPPDVAAVVATTGPDDPAVHLLQETGWSGPLVVVTWHPPDELGPIPSDARRCSAGQIVARLPAVTSAAITGAR